jgi:hypothetical protein
MGRPAGKIPLGKPRLRRVDNIKMDIQRDKMKWCELDCFGSGQGPTEGSCDHGNKPSGSINFWEILQ